MGNRLQRQDSASGTTNSTYDAANRLTGTTGAGASTCTSDADGNTLTGGGRTNAWDSQNRLASCAKSTPTGTGGTATYAYGADGLRRRASSFTTTRFPGRITPPPPSPRVTDYAYDGTMLVREGTGNRPFGRSPLTPANVTATYLIGPRGPEYRRDDTQTEIDSQGRTVTKARWYVYDGLGSVVGEVDPLGNLTSSPKYDVYGAVRSNGGSATSRQGFVGGLGHVSDTETGLVYMRARYYDPSVGRFTSEDPGRDGNNWFAYCACNPVNIVDGDGKAGVLADHMSAGDWLTIAGLLTVMVAYARESPVFAALASLWALGFVEEMTLLRNSTDGPKSKAAYFATTALMLGLVSGIGIGGGLEAGLSMGNIGAFYKGNGTMLLLTGMLLDKEVECMP